MIEGLDRPLHAERLVPVEQAQRRGFAGDEVRDQQGRPRAASERSNEFHELRD